MIRIGKVEPSVYERIKSHFDAITTAFIQAIKPDRITVEYPRERRKYPDTFRGFLIFDKDRCISCFRCAQICPANAIKMEFYDRYYPSVDYAKCIFCHFCVESCPTGALRSSKVHDVAFKSLDEMHIHANCMMEIPEMVREEEIEVEYEIEDGKLKLHREVVERLEVDYERMRLVLKKELSSLEIPPPPPVKKRAYCKDPESCLGCRMCASVCPQNAIKYDRKKRIMSIDVEKCVGCGFCVRECPMEILDLKVM